MKYMGWAKMPPPSAKDRHWYTSMFCPEVEGLRVRQVLDGFSERQVLFEALDDLNRAIGETTKDTLEDRCHLSQPLGAAIMAARKALGL